MATKAHRRRMTLEQFLKLPEQKPALEYAPDGTVTQKMSPRGKHSAMQKALIELIERYGRRRRLAVALPELRTVFGGAAYVPDVAVYRWERVPRDALGEIANDFYDPPDVAFEIVSPEQRVTSLVRKCVWYVNNGVTVGVIVDPDDRSVLVLRRDQAPRICGGDDPIDLSDALPGFELTAGQLFSRLRI